MFLKRFIPVAAACMGMYILAGCAQFMAYRYWNVYSMVKPVVSSEKTYSDDNIDIRFWIDEKKIHFKLKNLTDAPLTLNWAKASFVNVDGVKFSLANIDSIFTDRRDSPPPTTVEPGAYIVDFVAPAQNVEKLEEWTWYVYPLFNLVDERAYDNKGKIFGIDMPVEARGKWKTYSFRFEVSHVIPAARRVR